MNTVAYKPNAEEVLTRLRSLYERSAGDRIFATVQVPSPTIARFKADHPHAECAYPDPAERVEFWDCLLRERADLEDDSMPVAYLSEMDQGLYGGLLGGEVRFLCHPDNGWISSMIPPLLRDWSEFDRLRFDENHLWWKRYRRQLDAFIQGSAGKWGISHFILIDGLNFVFELLGATQTYLSLDEHPDMVRRATDFALDLNLKVQRAFFDAVPSLAGGTFSNFAQWLPGRVVSESIDPYHMTSVAYFERWGREPVERILSHFDGGVIHIHGNGRHLLQAASSLKGLKAMLLADDVGFPRAFEVIGQLQARTGDVPLSCFAEFDRFVERLDRHELPGGVLYQVRGAPDVATANRCMQRVRQYRA